jgi:hypothetical protein
MRGRTNPIAIGTAINKAQQTAMITNVVRSA